MLHDMATKKDPNPYAGVFANVDKTAPSVTTAPASPFAGVFDSIDSGDRVGATPKAVEPTTFRKIQNYKADATVAATDAKKANSFGTLALDTLNPLNLAKSAFDLAKSVVSKPVESARNVALGISNGITLGGTDYLQRKAFQDEAVKSGMDPHEAEQAAVKMLQPADENQQSIKAGFDIAGAAVPYIATDGAVAAGLKYAAPGFVAKYALPVRLLSNIGVFNALGQTSQTFKPKDQQNRGQQAAIDTALAILFPLGGAALEKAKGALSKGAFKGTSKIPPDDGGGGAVPPEDPSDWRSIRTTAFGQPKNITPVTNTEPLVHPLESPKAPEGTVPPPDGGSAGPTSSIPGTQLATPKTNLALPSGEGVRLSDGSPIVQKPTAYYLPDGSPAISSDALKEGAVKRIKELEGQKTRTPEEQKDLDFLKANTTNVDALYKRNANPPKANVPVPNANSSMKVEIPVGEKNVSVDIATSDMEALQNFIKGSGEIDYKTVDNLGKDASGNPINARHEFNPKTGRHTIYVTDKTTAESLAHELGHYFDTSLTNSTKGLAKILPDYAKNQQAIEDVLGTMAVKRLGGNATAEEITAEIKNISEGIQKETHTLSSIRAAGAPADSSSEKFADAVSMVLTRPGSKEGAPLMTELLQTAEKFDKLNLLGKGAGKAIEDAHATNAEPSLLTAKEPAPTKAYVAAGTDLKGEGDLTLSKTKKAAGEGAQAVEMKPGTKILLESQVPADIQGDRAATMAYAKEQGFDAFTDGSGVNIVNKGVVSETKAITEVKPVTPRERTGPTLPRDPTGHQPDSPAFRAEKITTDDDLETFMNTKILPKLEGTERIGKTNEEIITRSFSSNLNEKSFDTILTKRFGNLSEDVLAAKRLMTDKATALQDVLGGRDVSTLNATEMRDVMKNYQQTVEMFETFAGVRTELSNAFRTLGIAVNKGENDALRAALGDIQTAIGDERDPFGIIKRMLKARENGPVEYYFELWYPALLSGWKTSARNITGNASNLVFDTLSSLFTKQGRSEIGARVDAIIKANKEGLNNAQAVLKGQQFFEGKLIESKMPGEDKFKGPFAFLNKVEYVGRFLNAQDAYFSNAFKRSEIAAQRVGDFTYGLENKEAIDALNQSVADAAGARGTFRNDFEYTAVGKLGQAVTSLKVGPVWAAKLLANFVFPFVKTIANITDRQIDFLPIANLDRTFFAKDLYTQRANRILADADLLNHMKKDAIDGGMTLSQASQYANGEVNRVRDQVISRLRNQQMGKFYMGLTALAAGIPLAASGRISGTGPAGKNERAVLMKTGWRPNSIKIGDTWLPYQNTMLPMAAILSALGNMNDAMAYGADNQTLVQGVWNGLAGFARSETEQSFLSGLSTLFNPDLNPEQQFTQFAANAIPIPALWTQTKDAILPGRYDTRSLGDAVAAKIGLTNNVFTGEPLQPKLDAFGDQVKADLIYGLTPPILNATKNDPVLDFMTTNRAFIGKPQPATQLTDTDGKKRSLTPAEYTDYVEQSGKLIYDEIKSEVDGGAFTGLTHEEIKTKLNTIARQKRAEVKGEIPF